MSVPFTQYLRPDGRPSPELIDRPADVEAVAKDLIRRGVRFDIEFLMSGVVSLTAEVDVAGEVDVLSHALSRNDRSVLDAVDALVETAWSRLLADAMGCGA